MDLELGAAAFDSTFFKESVVAEDFPMQIEQYSSTFLVWWLAESDIMTTFVVLNGVLNELCFPTHLGSALMYVEVKDPCATTKRAFKELRTPNRKQSEEVSFRYRRE